MDIREAYKVMQSQCGIEVGDKVRVLRKAKDYEMGWGVVWLRNMNSHVGSVGVVGECGEEDGFTVHFNDGDRCWLPFFVLELVEKGFKPVEVKLNEGYTATVFPDKIKVGCQEFDPVVLDRLVQAHKSVTSTKE